MTPKQLLTIFLDTPFTNPELLSYIAFNNDADFNPHRVAYMVGSGVQRLIRDNWGHLPAPLEGTTNPVVCKNCRKVVGQADAEVLIDNCRSCGGRGKVTETRKSVDRLLVHWNRSGIESILPIIMHLAETPLPYVDAILLFGEG